MTPPTNGHPYVPQQPMPQPQAPASPPLFPTAADEEDVPWARQNTGREPLTGRSRRHLRDLPSWDPTPPGEIFVHRHHRAD